MAIAGVESDNVYVARYNGDGSVDSAFGTGGVTRVDLGAQEDTRSLFVQGEDNGLLLVSRSLNGRTERLNVVRFLGA